MMTAILDNTAYFIGIGVEAFAVIVCAVLLALMLSGALFKWMAKSKVTRTAKAAAKAAAAEARAAVAEELAAQEAAEAEAAKAQAEIDAVVKAEAEAAAAEAAEVAAEKHAKEQAAKAAADREANEKAAAQKAAEKAAAAAAKAEEEAKAKETVTSESEKVVVKERVIERTVVQENAGAKSAAVQEAAAAQAEESEGEDDERDFVVVHDGIVFNDSKSVTELYEELTPEQQSYFDELREEALTKPDAELAISKNFVSVKIGKRNLIKLLIKRGVTVAEFMLENDALKQLRLSNTNKRGKSTIKVKPTVVQVLDLASLKVAVDMINLAYEELMLGD